MDRTNLGDQYHGSRGFGDGAFDVRFHSSASAFPSLDLPAAMGRGEQSTATRLSKPRMTKARKQLASFRARPAVIADAKDGSGFSTFRYHPAVAASAASESDGAQGLRERFVGWNPFDPKAWAKVSESSKLDKFENLKHGMDTGAFVFQSGTETSSVVDKTQMDSDSSGLRKSDTMSSSNMSQNPEVPIVSNSPPTKLESTFVFAASSTNNSDSKGSISVNSMKALDNMTNDKSGIYNDKFPSLFSSRVQISSNSNKSSFNASNDPSSFSLHDEMEKLNLQNYDNPIAYQRKSQTEENVKHNSVDSFIFGNNNSAPTSLCDNMEKLNLQNLGDHIASETKNQADESVKHNSAKSFLFDNGTGAPISSGGSPVNALAKKTDKMTIQSPVDALSEKINKVSIQSMLASQSGETVFNFTSTQEQVVMPYMEFRSSRTTDDMLKENLVSGPRKSMLFGGKKAEAKASRMRKRNSKLNSFIPQHQTFSQTFPFTEEAFESKYSDSVHCYSPMDYSPCKENLVPDQSSREDSLPMDESNHIATSDTTINSEKFINIDESKNLISATRQMNIAEDNLTHREPDHIDASDHFDTDIDLNSSENFVQNPGIVNFACEHNIASKEMENALLSEGHIGETSKHGTCFTFTSSVKGFRGSDFTFGSASFTQVPSSTSKHQHLSKSRMEIVPGMLDSSSCSSLFGSTTDIITIPSKSMQPDIAPKTKCVGYTTGKTNAELETKKDLETSHSQRVAEQENCVKWRLRGNQAYANGHLLKAEEYYTQGLNSVSQKENSGSCSRELMLCYCNRAAALMSLGRMREALNDCMLAVSIDSHFLRAQVRTANCYLALGDIDRAMKHYKECLSLMHEGSPDAKILTEATDGLAKAQQVADHVGQAEEILQKRTSNEVTKALQLVSESLLISTHSERLMEWKAEALLMLRRYDKIIKFCEQTMEHVGYNILASGTNEQSSKIEKPENFQDFPSRHWRLHLMAKANFFLGKLDEAFELLKKRNQRKSIVEKNSNEPDSSTSLFATIHRLLHLKAAGNKAFKEERNLDAIEHYSAALAFNIESRPFAAICLSNRAAAYQSLGQITDAISDCSLAIALDSTYPKALSRRASLYERIKDYEQASNDLRRLVSLLESQVKVKNSQNIAVEISASHLSDLPQARFRLSIAEAAAKKDIPLDMHLILGIEPSSSAADIKKAYRKAALRHHPDKAGQILVRSETPDRVSREVAEEVHRDADRLFKMIGEAYTVLLDATRYKFTKI